VSRADWWRAESAVVAELGEQVELLDELATRTRAEFERMAEELEG